MKRLPVVVLLFVAAVASGKKEVPQPSKDAFYVYSDKAAKGNHYIPSGWMGDYGDIKLNDGYRHDCADGQSCIEIKYTAEAKQGANWSGMYWQHPANNWGNKPGGFDLTGYKRLTFWVKGAKGDEYINEFKVGGITGEWNDSDTAAVGPVTLTTAWQKVTIDLEGKDLTKIIGGFCWATSKDVNDKGFTMYLDEIRFER